jgi:hypothetical protein
LKSELNDDYKLVKEEELSYYVFLKLYTVLRLFETLYNGTEEYIDFYKLNLSKTEMEKAYRLVVKNDIIDIIKYNINNLIKINNAIINRVKILIKKFFNFKNIKINKLNNIIKQQSKLLNIDNLLYISYIFNVI